MKRIIGMAVIAMAFGAGAASAEQQEQTAPKAAENADAYVNVAQASQNADRASLARDEISVRSRKASLHEEMGLAGDGVFPSRGGPLDD
jgi:hypothetical protein